MFCERSGQVGEGGFGVALIFAEDVEDDVSSFKANGNCLPTPVIGTREERANGFSSVAVNEVP